MGCKLMSGLGGAIMALPELAMIGSMQMHHHDDQVVFFFYICNLIVLAHLTSVVGPEVQCKQEQELNRMKMELLA